MEEMDKNILSMIDHHGHRRFIVPAEVKGIWARRKSIVQSILLIIFLFLPWIKINGEQSILLDISGRHFVFFGVQFFAHDTPLLFLLIFIFFVSILLMTALWGRVWCGWACPQTVFIERIYRKIEILAQGNYIERRKLGTKVWTSADYLRAVLKWFLFFIFSSLFAHSFIAYWISADSLLRMITSSPLMNWTYFLLVSGMTVLLLFNFGWFREQFCLIMCPYGRLQSTLADAHSINVMYDEKRGEPRKGMASSNTQQGDCVSCGRCVQVCPTGIDIRNGVQMECIGCTACIDACDEIMQKVKKPTGLIRYKPLTDKKISWFRGRIVGYSVALLLATIGFVTMLLLHTNLRIEVLRAKDKPYSIQEIAGQKIVRNHFVLRLENKSKVDDSIEIRVLNEHNAVIPENPVQLKAEEIKNIPIFIESKVDQFDNYGRAYIELSIYGAIEGKTFKVPLLGPFR